jgi:hypothetical protein
MRRSIVASVGVTECHTVETYASFAQQQQGKRQKGEFALEQAIKAQTEIRSIVLHFL